MQYATELARSLSGDVTSNVLNKMIEFTNRYRWHHGLYVLADTDLSGGTPAIERETERVPKPKADTFLPAYFNEYFWNVPLESLRNHSHSGDGAIGVNYHGKIKTDYRYVKQMKLDKIAPELRTGSGHIFLASGTVDGNIIAFIGSSSGKISVVENGRLAESYTRPPPTWRDLPYMIQGQVRALRESFER